MRPIHIGLSVIVALLWGLNYVAIPIGLENFPPIFLSFLRLLLSSLTLIFFVKPPKVSMKMVFFYGLTMFSMQFGFLFSSLRAGLGPDLAPIMLQTQVFFTAAFALIFLKEKLTVWQVAGALIAFSGIILVGTSKVNATFLGIILVLAAAISWGMGNVIGKKIGKVDKIALVVWGSILAFPPVLIASLFIEGPHEILEAFKTIDAASIGSILYLTYGSLLLGFLIWNHLIYLYPLATIAPFTLLVPVFGALSSSIAFTIPIHAKTIIAFVLVILGLSIDMFGYHRKKRSG
ncbi:MAG: EamA family transporter [Parachlamydiales bacterium]|nr:EamA family transporter [Parachlamydiales bacterium]